MKMKSQIPKSSEIKTREKNHFSSKKIEWLEVLEDDHSSFRKKILKQTLLMWDKDIKFIRPKFYKNKIILDAGCGNLRYTSYFKDKGAELCIGGDISLEFIKSGLKKKYFYVYDSKVSTSHNKYMQLDCEYMPFKHNSFDIVLFFHSIHHIPRKDKAICESFNILKKRGYIIISDLNGSHFLRRIGDIVGKKIGIMSPDEKASSPKEIITLLKKSGFNILEIHYMNAFSEILFHVFNLLGMLSFRLSLIFKTLLFIINPIDEIIEKNISTKIPRLFWRYIIIAQR